MNVLIKNVKIWKWRSFCPQDTFPKDNGEVVDGMYLIIKSGKIHVIDREPFPEDNFDSVIDCGGSLLLPGLIDSHIHVGMLGESQYYVNLADCFSLSDLKDKVKRHIEKHSDIEWIIGVGWDHSFFGRYPTRFDLDEVSDKKPIFLWRACWHIGVANTFALERAGIDLTQKEFPFIGGTIDCIDGSPTGILRERAVELMTTAFEKKDRTNMKRFIYEGLKMCLSAGLTAVHTNDKSSLSLYKELQEEDKLPIRIFLTPLYSDLDVDVNEGGICNHLPISPPIDHFSQTEVNYSDPILKLFVDRVKLFSDGSLGAETAALRFPNQTIGDINNPLLSKGLLINSSKELCKMIAMAKSKSYRVEIHAIGDAAAEQVLTCLENAGVQCEDRPILTHCQILGEDLISKMKSLGCIANIQPSFVPTDMRWINDRLSSLSLEFAYCWKTLLQAQIHTAGGSDAPIESCSPFEGIYDAIYRESRTEKSVFNSNEALTFSEALWIYTMGGAYACKCENIFGAIECGYVADFVLVDPEVVENPRLLRSQVLRKVIIGGEVMNSTPVFSTVLREGPFIPGKGSRMSRCYCCT